MFKQKIKFFKKYKLNQVKTIKQTHKYIYIFRYIDFNIVEITSLKKILKELQYKSLILKQNLTGIISNKLKGQGPLLIIYGNQNLNLINKLKSFKKLDFIYLMVDTTIYSNLKIKQIVLTNQISLNCLLIYPFLNFLYSLRKTRTI